MLAWVCFWRLWIAARKKAFLNPRQQVESLNHMLPQFFFFFFEHQTFLSWRLVPLACFYLVFMGHGSHRVTVRVTKCQRIKKVTLYQIVHRDFPNHSCSIFHLWTVRPWLQPVHDTHHPTNNSVNAFKSRTEVMRTFYVCGKPCSKNILHNTPSVDSTTLLEGANYKTFSHLNLDFLQHTNHMNDNYSARHSESAYFRWVLAVSLYKAGKLCEGPR